jgi:CarD family transcriptional regulator
MAQKATLKKSGAKKATTKPARKPARVQAAASASKVNKRKPAPPPKAAKGRDKASASPNKAAAKHTVAKPPLMSKPVSKPQPPAKPVSKAPVPPPVKATAPSSKVAPRVMQKTPAMGVAPAAMAQAAPATVVRTMPAAASKLAAQRIIGPAAIQKPVVAAQPAAPAAPKKPVSQRHGFKTGEWIVYPAHGVGRIVTIEEQEIAGLSLELFVITFEKDKMTLRVPTGKSQSVGMRKLADEAIVRKAMETLKGRARVKRTMWSRRAQEYEAKINSGDLIAIAEVVRDLYRSESQPEQSYSERQLYEAALDRMAREIAAVEKLDERGAVQRITDVLSKSAKGRRVAAEEAAEVEAA